MDNQPDATLFGRPGGRLHIARDDPSTMVQIGFWPDSAETVHARINEPAGLQETLLPGRFADKGSARIARTAFDTYLLIDATVPDMEPTVAATTDLSDSRRCVSIDGPAAESFLNRDLAVDLSLTACPVGSVLQTAMHHVPVLLLRTSETRFHLYAYRSYMDDLTDWMLDMALPFES